MNLRTEENLQLSVVIPTYNERDNISILLGRLESVLADIDYEIIVVDDDSPDLTWQVVEDHSAKNSRVRVLRRLEGKGLSRAVMAGFMDAKGACFAVMDADLQHDEAILPKMLQRVSEDGYDVCVGSRDAEGGSYGEWSLKRKIVSYGARWLSSITLGALARDPMSGFFAISRDSFQKTVERVNPSGFKILLEFLARGENFKVCEVGYTFKTRVHGETKLNASVALEYLLALIDLRFGWLIPNQFVKFALVGLVGSLVNFGGFAISQFFGNPLSMSVIIGVELSIVWTYLANNFFTFTPMTFRGKNLLIGFGLYQIVCCYGLVIQLSVIKLIFSTYPILEDSLLTLYLTYMIGVVFAAVGNYFLHSYYTWNRLGFSIVQPRKTSSVPMANEQS